MNETDRLGFLNYGSSLIENNGGGRKGNDRKEIEDEDTTAASLELGSTGRGDSVVEDYVNERRCAVDRVVQQPQFEPGPYYLKTLNKNIVVTEAPLESAQSIADLYQKVATNPDTYAKEGGFFNLLNPDLIREKIEDPDYLTLVMTEQGGGGPIAFVSCCLNLEKAYGNYPTKGDKGWPAEVKNRILAGEKFCGDIDVVIDPDFQGKAVAAVIEKALFEALKSLGYKWAVFEIYEITGIKRPGDNYRAVPGIKNGPSERVHFEVFEGERITSFRKYTVANLIVTNGIGYSIRSHLGAFKLDTSLIAVSQQLHSTVDGEKLSDPPFKPPVSQ